MRSSYIKYNPWVELSICHCMRLLKAFASFSFRLTIWAIKEKSKAASGWHIVTTYAACICPATYWSFRVIAFWIVPLKLVKSMDSRAIRWRFLHYLFCVRHIILNSCVIQPPLNFMVLLPSFSPFLANKLILYSCYFSFIANVLSDRNNISSVWIPTIFNLLLLFLVYNKQGSLTLSTICNIRLLLIYIMSISIE